VNVKSWGLLSAGLLASAGISAAALPSAAQVTPPKLAAPHKKATVSRPLYVTKAPIIMLKDVDSGAILFSRGENKKFAPASMTKAMTAYVVFDLIRDGKLRSTDQFQMTEAIWRQWQARRGNSTMFLGARERVTVDQLLLGLLTVSGNDAATLLAVGIDGSEAEFVKRMNRVSKQIGMADSQFGTPSGWPDEGATMVTAGDMIRLADRIIRDHPEAYARYFSQPNFTHGEAPDGTPIVQRNRNPLLGRFAGADGLKTGYTVEAGYCFLGSATRDGRRLIMVVAGMDSSVSRRDEAERLMQWGFSEWEGRVIAKAGSPMMRMAIGNGRQPELMATNSMDIRMTVPRGHDGGYQAKISGNVPLRAPIASGDQVARFTITPNGLPPQETPLVAVEAVEQGGPWSRMRTGIYRVAGI
jgi:D-alanyl-D-alanine carboxypeptidase (penicillin-binding protein 5/6)